MLDPRGRRSGWIGYLCLGFAVVIAMVTLLVVFTGQSLANLGELANRGSDDADREIARAEATATAEAAPTPTPEPDPISIDGELSAQSALVVHADSGTVLFEQAADEPVQPASTAKIITALTVLEHASPEDIIEILEEDVVDPVAESSMGLQVGDRVTVQDLLVGLMVPSGNDAAYALARAVGERIPGDEALAPGERFVVEMNEVAANLGLDTTHLTHVAGHDQEDQVVTARELAIAAEALLDRPSLVSIVAMPKAKIRVGGDRARVIAVENTNELLFHDGVYGVKTGTTSEAGQCLVVAYRDGEDTLIAVLLGSQDRYGDARLLLGLPEPPEPEDDDHTDDPEDTEG